jgi:hypothetical protein
VTPDELEQPLRHEPDNAEDLTPLPAPLPYHVADPTDGAPKVAVDPIADLRVSGVITRDDVDLAAELETRERPRIDAAELDKISLPPPTVPIERVDPELDLDDTGTPVARDSENELTLPRKRPLTGRDD